MYEELIYGRRFMPKAVARVLFSGLLAIFTWHANFGGIRINHDVVREASIEIRNVFLLDGGKIEDVTREVIDLSVAKFKELEAESASVLDAA